jgi:predicted Fe-Mo cluster-binding NifX family protein
MRICVTSQGGDINSQVDPRFGRCPYFVIVEMDTLEFDAIQNPNVTGMGGVGVQSGQFMSGKDVQVVLTGNVGPNAFRTLEAAGVEVITNVSGSVKEVIEKYKNGGLKPVKDPSVDSKFGMG